MANGSAIGHVFAQRRRRSPDSLGLSQAEQEEPALIELKSKTDWLGPLREKMQGWLIDPESRAIEVYRPGRRAGGAGW